MKSLKSLKSIENIWKLGIIYIFRGSSMVEQRPVKAFVVGSNPTRGVTFLKLPFNLGGFLVKLNYAESMQEARSQDF